MITCFMVNGPPKGKARPRVNTNTHMAYTPDATKRYEMDVRYSYINAYPAANDRIHTGPCTVQIVAYFQIPKSWPRYKRIAAMSGQIQPECKPDCDNIAKAILDALNGIAYKDDSQIVNLVVLKRYAERGHVTVRIESDDSCYPASVAME